MEKRIDAFRATLIIGWIALIAAGIAYARFRSVPAWVAAPSLAAFLAVYAFYLVPAFPAVRERVAGKRLPPFLVVLTVLPYLACCAGAVTFHWMALAQLVALSLALGLWYFALPLSPWSDIGFGALIAWVVMGGYFDKIYPEPYPHVEVAVLGKIAVFESAVLVLMLARRVPETGYGFLPTRAEWRIGILNFLYFIPIGLPLAFAIKAVSFNPHNQVWVLAGQFLGTLWVVALAEEFLFRGVIQPMIEKGLSNRAAALLLTSLLFGLVHLPFRTAGLGFPNWRWVLVAGTMGWFCGRARNQSGGIRAAIVTHTLTVTAWRAFF